MTHFARAKRILLVAMIGASAAACSSLPDWANPDTWGESSDPGTSVSDTSSSTDQTSQGATVAEAGDKYPVLADTPDKAPPTMSTDEQKQVANALVGDRTQAQYSAEQLRAGAEAAAAPPSSSVEAGAAAASSPADNSTAGTGGSEKSSDGTAIVQTQSAAAPPAPPPAAAVAPRVAATQTVVPTSAPPAPATPDDAALGFQPSHAPPLDPSVAQMVGANSHGHLALGAAHPTARPAPSASYGPPAASVTLGNAGAIDANGIVQVQVAVSAFRAKGGQGFVRVVGHCDSASSPARALERAQAGATAVARELIKLGVPPKRVLVEASGAADGGQTRADIFLAS
ncbi:MAG TPA: OmpA family protein [Rhizomicrobium sp.]|nr:OmpA family protein [Rhizomicrobium sp.]